MDSLSLTIPAAGVSILATFVTNNAGERTACTAIDFHALSLTPSREIVRIDNDTLWDDAAQLQLLHAALRIAQPIIEGRLQAVGIKSFVRGKILACEPSN